MKNAKIYRYCEQSNSRESVQPGAKILLTVIQSPVKNNFHGIPKISAAGNASRRNSFPSHFDLVSIGWNFDINLSSMGPEYNEKDDINQWRANIQTKGKPRRTYRLTQQFAVTSTLGFFKMEFAITRPDYIMSYSSHFKNQHEKEIDSKSAIVSEKV